MTRSKQFRLIALAAIALVSSLPAPLAAARPLPGTSRPMTPSGSNCAGAALIMRSFHVTATPSKKVVQRGQKVQIKMKVTRPAHEDPADLGQEYEPPASVPEKDVRLGISIWVGKRTYFWGLAMSDANGEANFTIKVPVNSEVGPAYASASAQKWLKQDCPDILEDGYTEYENFLTVAP